MKSKHRPLGPNNTWKSGQRVPITGTWVDQYGDVSMHYERETFPPTMSRGGRKGGECAYRSLVKAAATANTSVI